jgi:hypothetical protein
MPALSLAGGIEVVAAGLAIDIAGQAGAGNFPLAAPDWLAKVPSGPICTDPPVPRNPGPCWRR